MKSILVTGSSGLVGSEAVVYFEQKGWLVYGVDNNMRRSFFGADGDTTSGIGVFLNNTSSVSLSTG